MNTYSNIFSPAALGGLSRPKDAILDTTSRFGNGHSLLALPRSRFDHGSVLRARYDIKRLPISKGTTAKIKRDQPLRVRPESSGRIAEFSEHEAD
jgi:hypothetical protein